MLGSMDKSQFNPDRNYETFYENHRFAPFHLPFDSHQILARAGWTLDYAKDSKATSLLDLCCLDGFVSLTCGKHCATLAKIHGVDLSAPGIDRANELAGELIGKEVRYFQASVEDYLTEATDTYDMILMFEAVEHFKDTPRVIELAKQRLNPGGSILISTPDAEGFYGIGNDDACHLRYYSHKYDKEWGDLTMEWQDRPILSLPDMIESCGGIVHDNMVWNDLIHLRAIFD